MDAHGLSAEGLEIKPQKILLIGTPGSGKTTVAQRLSQDTGFPYASIDECRIRHGDGTGEGEVRAWENFLAICRKPAPGILEFCGLGTNGEEVRDNLLCSTVPVSVIWLVLPLDTCIPGPRSGTKRFLIHSRGHLSHILCRSSTRESVLPGTAYGAGNHIFMQHGRNFRILLRLMRCIRRSGRSV